MRGIKIVTVGEIFWDKNECFVKNGALFQTILVLATHLPWQKSVSKFI